MIRDQVERWLGWRQRVRSGQTLVVGALVMTTLVAFTGLAIDVGVWLVAKARLQRAVDAAALSVILDKPTAAQANGTNINSPVTGGTHPATDRARTIILNQGIPAGELGSVYSAVPRFNRFTVTASQTVSTAFARVIGVNSAVISAQATSDINTYLEIPVSPVCGGAPAGTSIVCDGGVGDMTMDQFGTSRPSTNGDPYTNPSSVYYNDPSGNPYLPEGYLYRIAVEPGYTGALEIQVFDPDNWNQNNPHKCRTPAWSFYTPSPSSDPCNASDTQTAEWAVRTSLNGGTGLPKTLPDFNTFATGGGYHLFWRVDECLGGGETCQDVGSQTSIEFTIWHLSPDALDPLYPIGNERRDIARVFFRDSRTPPASWPTQNCRTTGTGRPDALDTGTPCTTYTWTCTAPFGTDVASGNNLGCTDLRWVHLHTIPDVTAYPALPDGSRSFFIYVRTLSPTIHENGYHLRSGPPVGDTDQNSASECGSANEWTKGKPRREHVNGQVWCQWHNGRPGANTKIFARRAMPTNTMQPPDPGGPGRPYVVWLGYIPKAAAGQQLLIRYFDLDRSNSYPCTTLNANNSLSYLAYVPGPSGGIVPLGVQSCGSRTDEWGEYTLTLPAASDPIWSANQGFWLYTDVFRKDGVYDTVTWEVQFIRARLVR